MSDNDTLPSYHVLWATSYYDSGAEVDHVRFNTLDEVYAYLVEQEKHSWDVTVIQGNLVHLNDERLRAMWKARRTPEDLRIVGLRELAERETYERLKKKYEGTT